MFDLLTLWHCITRTLVRCLARLWTGLFLALALPLSDDDWMDGLLGTGGAQRATVFRYVWLMCVCVCACACVHVCTHTHQHRRVVLRRCAVLILQGLTPRTTDDMVRANTCFPPGGNINSSCLSPANANALLFLCLLFFASPLLPPASISSSSSTLQVYSALAVVQPPLAVRVVRDRVSNISRGFAFLDYSSTEVRKRFSQTRSCVCVCVCVCHAGRHMCCCAHA